MAVYDINMTQEEIMASVEPANPGTYRLTFEGFLMNEDRGDIFFPTKAGGKMVKARFRTNSVDPSQHGKSILYNATIGAFTFANLCKALPIMERNGINSEVAIGMEIEAAVEIRYAAKNLDGSWTNIKSENEADGRVISKGNNISKMKAA